MRLAVLGFYIALMSMAYAQSNSRPAIVLPAPEDSYNLSVGEATKLSFPTSFDRIDLTSDPIAPHFPAGALTRS